MHTKALPYIFLLSLFWGTNIVASRFGIGEFDPYFFITLRLTIATVFFAAFLLLKQRAVPRGKILWQKALLSGVIGVAVPMSTFILSLQYQSSGVTSIYVTMAPVLIVIAAHFFLPDEQLTRNKILGVVLALLGSLFLALRGESGLANVSRANPLGFGLIMVGLVSETINTIYVRLRMKELDPIQVTSIRLLAGAVVTLGFTLTLGDISFTGITRAGYFSLGVCSFNRCFGWAIFGVLCTAAVWCDCVFLNVISHSDCGNDMWCVGARRNYYVADGAGCADGWWGTIFD